MNQRNEKISIQYNDSFNINTLYLYYNICELFLEKKFIAYK